jgi:hypothetical protein
VNRSAAAALIFLFTAFLLPRAEPQKSPPPAAFDEPAASRLLMQLSQALEAHSQNQFLAVFDLARMKDGPAFRQQIGSFFSHTESFRVHLNLLEVKTENEQATVAADAEMEGQPMNRGPAWRRNERLNFVAVASAAGKWKFVEVQPRSFFGLP